jgi:hypothetical protein
VRLFARDRSARLDGVALPAVAAVLLAIVLAWSVAEDDVPTRLFVVAAALFGVPVALWRGRALAGVPVPSGEMPAVPRRRSG